MKKSLLFSLLTICTINSALAENIQNLDTPVNWSASATFNTIMNLHQDDPNAFDIADLVAGGISIWSGPRSAKWLCEHYNDAARRVGSKVYNCSDVITKVIIAHNNIVLSQKNIKIIDKLMPDTKVYWNPVSVSWACMDTDTYVKENGPTDVSLRNSNRYVCSDTETLDLYNKPYSINELFDVCLNFFFTSSNSLSLNKVCSMFVDKALEEHNRLVTNQEQIKYGDNFPFKYTIDKEIEENRRKKFLSYNNKIIDHSNRSFDIPGLAHTWAELDIEYLITKDIIDITYDDLDTECSGDCNKFGDDTVMCYVTYKTDTITVKYIFDDICDSLID